MSRFRLSGPGREDVELILAWSLERFGEAAADRYERLIGTALIDLAFDAERLGSRAVPELGRGTRIYHLRHSRQRARTATGVVAEPRHFVLYRPIGPGEIGVARLLHDSMDLPRYATEDFGSK